MNAIDPTPSPVPQRLEEPLRIVAGRARLLAWFHAFFKLAALCAIVWLLVVLTLGSRLQVPTWASIPVALAGWAIVIYGAFHILRDLFRRRGGIAAAARLADAALPDSQERLSSAIEIAQEKDPNFRGSPELVAVLMRQAEYHADNMDPGQIISGKQVMRWLGAAGITLLIWFTLLVIFTPNMLLGLQRMFQPWTASDAPPAPIVEVQPGDHVYAQGADVEISVNVKPPEGLSFDTGNGAIAAATLVQHFISANGGRTPDVSLPMERIADVASNRAFRHKFYNLQQSFTYKILVDGGKNIGRGESPQYTITVETRPAVADVEVLYTYPQYTALNPRTEHSREGNLEALTGTKARLTIHATEPVQTAQLLVGDDGSSAITTLNLTPLAPAATATAPATEPGTRETLYTGELLIDRNTQYHIKLVKADGRDNLDKQARTIRAKPDSPPTVVITQPDPKSATQVVRPDDTVPLKFLATDDFGITKVEALIQIDQRSEQAFNIPLAPDTRIAGDWSLDLSALLKYLPAQSQPRQITYQLRATDNRDPNPQTGLSQKQTLTLDKAATSITQRLDTQAAKNLSDAAAQAAAKLQDAQTKLDELQKSDRDATLSNADRQKVSDIQKDLSQAGQLLRQAADRSDDSRLSPLARQLRDVADQPIKRAEEDAIKTGLATDQPTARQNSETSAARNTQDALNQLQQLANNVQNTAKSQPLAQSLENLAKEQQALANELAQHPNDPKLLERQRELQSRLDQIIKDNPQLQKPAAGANQPRVDELVRKLRDIEQAQQPITDQLDNQKNAATSAEQAAALAKEQQKLNDDIKNFNAQNAETIRQAGTKTPDAAKLDPIVKQLQDNKLAPAALEQKSTASALDKAANDLKTAQDKADDPARQQAAKDIANAEDLRQETRKLDDEVRKAKDAAKPATRSNDPALQDAQSKLAEKIRQASQQIANRMPNNSPAKTAAQAAAKATDAAKTAARSGDAERAQQQLQDAANQLEQAAHNEQAALNKNGSPIDPAAAQAAEQQARDLAAAQKNLAEKSEALANSRQAADAARANAATTADQQRELAKRIDDAAKDAQNLQQQTQGSAPELSNKAAQAAKALQQAADAQRQASQSTRANNPADAAGKQNQAADRVAQADEALSGQRPQRPGASSPQNPTAQNPSSPQNPPQNPNQNSNQTPSQNLAQNSNQQNPAAAQSVQAARSSQSQALKGDSKAAQGAADQLAQAARQIMNNSAGQPNANPNQPNANAGQPQPSSPSANQVAATAPSAGTPAAQPGAQSTAQSPNQPKGSPSASAQPAPGQTPSGQPNGGQPNGGQPTAGQPGSGKPNGGQSTAGQPTAGQPGQGQPLAGQPGQGQPTPGQPGSGQPGNGQPLAAQPGPGQPGSSQPGAAQPGASQSGAGQPSASGQPGPGQPGPNAIASGQSGDGQPGKGQPSTGQPRSGQSTGTTGTPSSGTPGSGGGGKILTSNGREDLIPQEVRNVGVAPSDWIKLSPEYQDQLLHSAQQPGPPEYRDMIKNYYTRIARMQSPPAPSTPGANP
jgi:hypothetical protein